MISQDQINSGQELLAVLINKAHESDAFKEMLIKNPVACIEEIRGRKYEFSEGKNKILVEDQTDDSVIYLNLPAEPNLDEMELSEEQLEMVAGGITWITTSSNVCIGGAVAVGAYLLGRNT